MNSMSKRIKRVKRANLLIVLSFMIAGCAIFTKNHFEQKYGTAEPRNRVVEQLSEDEVNYWSEVKPVIENRCLVCHGCYDAPCQLKLSAIEGIERGASKDKVYNSSRIGHADLSRLFEDSISVEGWREKEFFPVLNEHTQSLLANREASVMYQMLKLKEKNPLPQAGVLSDDFTLGLNRSESCPRIDEMNGYTKDHPQWGMPYALPGLNYREQDVLKRWIEEGAKYTERPKLGAEFKHKIEEWEYFLNNDTFKMQLASRYIFEHLFLANLYFDGVDNRKFFRLVRSATPTGIPIQLIATRRPYDDPGVERVYYRIVQSKESVVRKVHMPYSLNSKRMDRWQELFQKASFQVDELPGYDKHLSANPFITFQQIPLKSRYKFLLDEAKFTIMGFIKGSVCRGQVALNVIRDHFWVFFINPDLEIDDEFAEMVDFLKDELELPSVQGDIFMPLRNWVKYAAKESEVRKVRDEFLLANLSDKNALNLNLVWDGEGVNKNAALTIFRHFDSATVEKGLIGPSPQTAWIIGYPLLEQIHYLLVAGYDVYGNVGHQLVSRLHMDFLRMRGETNFLTLLPRYDRERERANWYKETSPETLEFLSNPEFESKVEPAIKYITDNPKFELFNKLRARLENAISTERELFNIADSNIRKAMLKLQTFNGQFTTLLPEVSFVQIKSADNKAGKLGFTILRNNAHINVSTLFRERSRLAPEENYVSIASGYVGAYPNVIMSVDESKINTFVDKVLAMTSEEEYSLLMDEFGIRRTHPKFWEYSDEIHEQLYVQEKVDYGVLDYNRYQNR